VDEKGTVLSRKKIPLSVFERGMSLYNLEFILN